MIDLWWSSINYHHSSGILIPQQTVYSASIINHRYEAKRRVLKLLVGQCRDQVLALSVITTKNPFRARICGRSKDHTGPWPKLSACKLARLGRDKNYHLGHGPNSHGYNAKWSGEYIQKIAYYSHEDLRIVVELLNQDSLFRGFFFISTYFTFHLRPVFHW